MAKGRFKDQDWNLADDKGNVGTWERVSIAVLMDIRDEMKANTAELRKLNTLLHCPNFIAIPRKLDAIHRKMPTRRKRSTHHA